MAPASQPEAPDPAPVAAPAAPEPVPKPIAFREEPAAPPAEQAAASAYELPAPAAPEPAHQYEPEYPAFQEPPGRPADPPARDLEEPRPTLFVGSIDDFDADPHRIRPEHRLLEEPVPRRSFGAWIAKRSDALSANLEGMISRGRANWQNLRTKPLSQDEFYQGAQGRWTRGMDWLRSYRARRAEPESTEEAEEPQASEPTNRRNGLVAAGAALTLTALVGTGLYLSRDKYTAPVQPTAPPAVTQTAPKQAPPAPAKPKEQTAPQIQQEAPVQPTRISGYQVDPSFLALTPEQRAETIERIGRRGGYWEVAKVIFSNARNNPKDYIIALGNMNDVDVMAEDVAQERKYMPRYAGNGIRDWFSAEEMTSLAQKVNAALAPQAPGAAPASTYLRLGSDSPHTEIASEGVVHAGGDSTLDARVGSSVQRAATPAWMVNGGIERQLAQLYGFKAQQGSRMDARTLFGQYKDIVLPELRSLSGRERFAAGGALHNLCQRVVAEYKRNEAIETYRAVLSSGYEGSAIRRTAELLGESYSTIAKRTRELRA